MPPSPEQRFEKLLSRLGQLVAVWNEAEAHMKLLLELLIDKRPQITIITAHIGSGPMCDALRTFANEFSSADLGERITHAVDYFEAAREYRNYYVHGTHPHFAFRDEDGSAWLSVKDFSARTRLVVHEQNLTLKDLGEAIGYCQELTLYLNLLLQYLSLKMAQDRPPRPEDSGSSRDVSYPSLPEKPRLPRRLQKSRRFLLDARRPPQPSQG